MKKQVQGFIFLVTLLYIGVISLLILVSMQHILLYHKAINQQEEQHQKFYQLENVVLQLAQSNLASIDRTCIIHEDSANQVMQMLIQNNGCSLANRSLNYQYLIEDLGEFPCLLVRNERQKHATHHRRISVIQREEGRPFSFLQIRFITTGDIADCAANEHFISLGVSSWRYFPSI